MCRSIYINFSNSLATRVHGDCGALLSVHPRRARARARKNNRSSTDVQFGRDARSALRKVRDEREVCFANDIRFSSLRNDNTYIWLVGLPLGERKNMGGLIVSGDDILDRGSYASASRSIKLVGTGENLLPNVSYHPFAWHRCQKPRGTHRRSIKRRGENLYLLRPDSIGQTFCDTSNGSRI